VYVMDVYHRDIGFPPEFVKPTGRVPIFYGAHARNAAQNDRYGRIRLQYSINLNNFDVIEVAFNSGDVVKYLFRGGYDKDYDLCIVLMPSARKWFCKTVWLNSKTDRHNTLDVTKYVTPN
jgi:hypothetical protein